MIKKSILRQFRKSAGMTQAEMAELLRVPLLTLTKWEAGPLDMKAKVLHARPAARTKNRRRG
jgi:DNA-binding XRE family transcriptional regulator